MGITKVSFDPGNDLDEGILSNHTYIGSALDRFFKGEGRVWLCATGDDNHHSLHLRFIRSGDGFLDTMMKLYFNDMDQDYWDAWLDDDDKSVDVIFRKSHIIIVDVAEILCRHPSNPRSLTSLSLSLTHLDIRGTSLPKIPEHLLRRNGYEMMSELYREEVRSFRDGASMTTNSLRQQLESFLEATSKYLQLDLAM